MADKLSKEQRSNLMRAVKNKGSKIENKLAKIIWSRGYRYRRNLKGLPGTPDIVFTKYKIAIFVDSEFWHGKDWEVRKCDFKSNQSFWIPKIERNIEKDKEVNLALKEMGISFYGFGVRRSTRNWSSV